MKINKYKVTSNLNDEGYSSFDLWLNDILVARNIPHLYYENNCLQLSVCSECQEPGCSSQDFVQVIESNNYVIWKEVLNDSNKHELMTASIIEELGTLIWSKSDYVSFVNLFEESLQFPASELNSAQCIDLWRINASKLAFPHLQSTQAINKLLDYEIGFYSLKYSAAECIDLFREFNMQWNESFRYEVIEITNEMDYIVLMLNIPSGYVEWNCVYIYKNEFLTPIGDNLALRKII